MCKHAVNILLFYGNTMLETFTYNTYRKTGNDIRTQDVEYSYPYLYSLILMKESFHGDDISDVISR